MSIPEAMQGATELEIYCWVHQCNRTIGQIRRYTGKTTQEIRAAIDKGCRLRWGYIPQEELPEMPDGMHREGIGEAPTMKVKKVDARANRIVLSVDKINAIKSMLRQGKSQREIVRALSVGWTTMQKIVRGYYD